MSGLIRIVSSSQFVRLAAVVGFASLTSFGACGSDMGGDAVVDRDTSSGGDDTLEVPTDVGDDTADPAEGDITNASEIEISDFDTSPPQPDVVVNEPRNIRIVTPLHRDEVRGAMLVRLEPIGMEEREVTEVVLEVNGEPVFWDTKLPTEFLLDTRDLGLFDFSLFATMRDGFVDGEHLITVKPDNAPMRFVEVTPSSRVVKRGEYVSVAIRMDAAADMTFTGDFSKLDSNFDPTKVISAPGNDTYYIYYPISDTSTVADGDYNVPITASTSAGNFSITYTQLTLSLRNSPTVPITVQSGIYVDGPLPQPSENFNGDKPVLSVSNDTVLTGGSSTLGIDFSAVPSAKDVVGVIFGVEGSNGFWQIPVDMTSMAQARVDADFFLRAFRSFEAIPDRLALRVALRDVRGRVSAYAARQVEVLEVGTGDVQVSLSWDKNADIDLHVRSPGGCEIFYGRRSCPNGGELDLDSNAGCNIDGVNNENVYWPTGDAPDGTYKVYVDHYANCSPPGPVKYTVTVTYCNQVEIYEGTFTAGSADSGGALSGRFITEFDVGQCARTVKGRVRYQDRTFNEQGFAAYSWQTLQGARVEVRHMATQAVIAAGVTDRNGYYDIGFPSAANLPGINVVAQARTDPDNDLRDIQVQDHPKFDKLYEFSSQPIILYPDTLDVTQDLDIGVDKFAGAFNVFDTLRKAYDHVRLQNGRDLGELKAYWKTGTDTTDTYFCSEYLYDIGECTELNTVSVQGKDEDRDEYDDMVIMKEFFKFALEKTSRDSHPGGLVDGLRTEPTRAWTEGLAEFFAADVAGSRYYVNSRPFGVTLVDDLEDMHTPFAVGVKSPDGFLSHWLVASMLWDLRDPLNEGWDNIDSKANGVYDVLFSYFPSEQFVDRGTTGVDLSDFIDGWVCRGWGGAPMLEPSLEHFETDYSFDGPQQCTLAP